MIMKNIFALFVLIIMISTSCTVSQPCYCDDIKYVVKTHTRIGINYSIYVADSNEIREIVRQLEGGQNE